MHKHFIHFNFYFSISILLLHREKQSLAMRLLHACCHLMRVLFGGWSLILLCIVHMKRNAFNGTIFIKFTAFTLFL